MMNKSSTFKIKAGSDITSTRVRQMSLSSTSVYGQVLGSNSQSGVDVSDWWHLGFVFTLYLQGSLGERISGIFSFVVRSRKHMKGI